MSGSNFFPKMKHIGLALMGLTLVFSGNGYADICGSPRPNRLKVTPDVSSFGYSAHLSTMTDNDYVMMKQAGVGFMRFDMNWDYLEKTPGVYDFSSTDSAIGKMLANGIRPLAVLDYGNHNYTTGGLTTDAWRAHFAAFAGAAAAHYAYLGQNGGKGMMFEIWNEPNGSQFWVPYPGAAALTPNGADYAALLHAASVAIHTADPNAAVIGPALSMLVVTPWVTTFLSQKFLDHNKISQSILADMDAFSVHPYRFGKNAPPESAIYSYNQLRIAMENASGPCQRQLPIVSSEWGYSATPTLPWALNADQQAAYQIRSWFVNLTLGVIPSISYDWKNDGTNPAAIEQNFGALTNTGVAKPLFTVASNLMNALKGMTYVQRLTPQDQYDWKLLFRGTNKFAIVSWTADPRVKDMSLQTPSVQIIDANSDSATFNKYQLLSAVQLPASILMTAPGHFVNFTVPVYNYKSTPMKVLFTAGLPTAAVAYTVVINPQTTYEFKLSANLGNSRSNTPYNIPITATLDGQAVLGLNNVQILNFQPLIVKTSLWGYNHLRVDIANPSGAAFDGYYHENISPTDTTGVVPVHLASGDLSTWVTVPLPKEATQYGQNILDSSNNVVSTGSESYISFAQFKDMPTVAANYSNRLLTSSGSVVSTAAASVLPMTTGPAHYCLNATYSFNGGSTQQIYALPSLNQNIPAGVRFLRFWLKGDGTTNGVSLRFVDNTKQIFQMNGMGTASNTDWRLVEIPLDDYNPFFEFSGQGAGDGHIHFPIHWDSLLLIQSLAGGGSGSVQISSPMYFY